MIKLLHQLNALYQFYKSAHWLAKGESFYQDHLLFERLYESLDDEMDTLVELMLAFNSPDKDFDAKSIAKETADLVKSTKDNRANLETAADLEADIILTIEKLNEGKIPVGLYNHLASIAQNHARNGYLIERALMK